MNQLTTIAALPGSGAGCSAALRAETVPAEKKGPVVLEISGDLSQYLKREPEPFPKVQEIEEILPTWTTTSTVTVLGSEAPALPVAAWAAKTLADKLVDPCPQCYRGGTCNTPSCGRKCSSELMEAFGTPRSGLEGRL
jgi:hypothetical protein